MSEDLLDTPNSISQYDDDIDVEETKLANKSLQIKELISQFELRLYGYMWKGNADKYYYTGKSMMGDDSIQKIMLLLHPFSREVILISNKKDYTWAKQLLRTRLQMINLTTKAIDVEAKNLYEIFRSFSNLLFNIGDVIVGKNSQDFLKGFFHITDEKKFDDYDFGDRKYKGEKNENA